MKKQRARNADDKAVRKQSIVDALQSLLSESRYPLPSANDIAARAGVSKGVIYHYFDSREEIFLTLHLQLSAAFFEQGNGLLDPAFYSLQGAREFVVQYFINNDLFAYLGLLAPTILESNVSVGFAREFKLAVAQQLDQLAHNWAQLEPGLEPETIRSVIMRFYYLALMQWQHFHPPAVIEQAFADESLWIMGGDLRQELTECFDWLWNGMKASPGPA